MSQRRQPASVIMFILMCVSGFLYFLVSSVHAIPAFGVNLAAATSFSEKFSAFWQLFQALVPILLLIIAYVLNYTGRGEIGSLFGLVLLILAIFKGADTTSFLSFFLYVAEIAFAFLVIAYSVSDGAYRNYLSWLMIAFALCNIRFSLALASLAIARVPAQDNALLGILFTLVHLFAFLAFIRKPGKQFALIASQVTE